MKGRIAHSVPLSDMALEIIEKARIYSGDSQFVRLYPYRRRPYDFTRPF
jgi:hypothetical protein